MVEELFSEAVRETMTPGSESSTWSTLSAPDAVSFEFGFPYPGSFPNEELIKAAEGLFAEEGDVALQYTGGEYADRLTEHVADIEGRRGIDCPSEHVTLTTGSTQAIDLVCRLFLDPGDGVLVESPTFMGALGTFETHGATLERTVVDEEGLDTAALERDLEARRNAGRRLPKLLYTIPTFHNPTGRTLPEDRREHLLELAAEYDFVVLEDDAYGLLRYDGDPVTPLRALDDRSRVVRVSTFSKTIAPGVRTGWILADSVVNDQLQRLNTAGPNRLTKGVLSRYIEDGHFDDTLRELRTAYERRRDRMLDELDDWMPQGTTWSTPNGGFFVWVTLPNGLDSTELLPDAADAGVLYLPGEHFSVDDGDPGSLRLAFSHVTPHEITEGVQALAGAARDAVDSVQ